MTRTLPRLCAITDRALAGGLSHELITRALVRGGARWIQLREKSLPPRQFFSEAAAAVRAAREDGPGGLIVVNDRADIALAAAADGVHVGRADLPAEEARRLLGPGALVGVSTHSVGEGIAASHLPVDYVAIGPVFPTATKTDPAPVVGISAVRVLASSIGLPVVAIGGIGPSNAEQVLEAGAHAIAVICALYDPIRSIEENVAALLRCLQSKAP